MKKRLLILLFCTLSLLANPTQKERDNAFELLNAISQNQTQKAISLIKEGVDFSYAHPDYGYRTPMRLAVAHDNRDVVNALFEAGYTFPKGSNRPTAIADAVWDANYEMAKLLVSHGADPVDYFYNDQSAVTIAVRDGLNLFVYMFIDHMDDAEKMVLAKYALETGNKRIFSYLVSNTTLTLKQAGTTIRYTPAFKVNYQDSDGRTILMYAVEREDFESISLLLSHGADLDIKDKNGISVRDIAEESNSRRLYDLIKNSSDSSDDLALIQAAKEGDTTKVKALLKKGPNLEATDEHGSTALIHASSQDHPEVVTLLLDAGARCDLKTSYGFTPLMIAGNSGAIASAKILLEHQCHLDKNGKPQFKDHNDWVRKEHPEYFKFLDEYKAAHGYR